MRWAYVLQQARTSLFGAFSVVLLLAAKVIGQIPQAHAVQEAWQGVVLGSDIPRSYFLSVFGLAELESPRPYRNSEYIAGLRISHPVLKTFRWGIECLQDRAYLSDSSLFLENRCAVDLLRRWDVSTNTNIYVQPKLELRSFRGVFDQRLKFHAELLHDLHAVRGAFRAFLEPAVDHQFHGFEKITAHAGVLWPVGTRIKVEMFDSVIIAKKPDCNIEALGLMFFVRFRSTEKRHGEIDR